MTFNFHSSHSQKNLNKAENYFKNRHEFIEGNKAKADNIEKAIQFYEKSKTEPKATIGLLKSYEFLASYTEMDENRKKATYKKAINLARRAEKKHPENAAIIYWHAANLARWGSLVDIIEAAQEGVLDELKKLTEKSIALNDQYNQGGALRLLGGMHLEAPNIPFVIDWPSNKTALFLLKKAYEIAPKHPANAYLYTKALYKNKKEDEQGNRF